MALRGLYLDNSYYIKIKMKKKTSFPLKNKEIDLIGIGNAIVDIVLNVEDDFLKANSLQKGSMNLIEIKNSDQILNKCKILKQVSGGSAANTVVALAKLGNKVEFIGRVKDDFFGQFFSEDLKESGVIFKSKPVKSKKSSAHSIILVTPDAQRTMCTYLGASTEFETENINFESIKKSKYLYLEGYLWDNELAKKAFIHAAEIAKESNTQIILSLSDPFCVDRHRKSFLKLIKDYINILFCNEEELKSLFEDNILPNCKSHIQKLCELSVITLGAKGSLIINNKGIKEIFPYLTDKLIDTTGAGDIYAGGFIHGLINGHSLEDCGRFGSICAGHIITQFGSRSNIDLKRFIQDNIT